MDDLNDSRLWAEGTKCYEQLMVVVDINDFGSWAHDSIYNEKLEAVDEMNDSRLLAQGTKCYEQLMVMIDISDFGLWAHGSRYYENL